MIDPEVQELIDEEVNRLDNPEATVHDLTILESRDGEPRWESDRFHREDARTEALERKADRFLAHMEQNEDG